MIFLGVTLSGKRVGIWVNLVHGKGFFEKERKKRRYWRKSKERGH